MEAGDWEVLLAYALLYLQQELAPLAREYVSLVFVASSITPSFRDRLALYRLPLEPEPNEPGVHRITGGIFDSWVIETDEMALQDGPS